MSPRLFKIKILTLSLFLFTAGKGQVTAESTDLVISYTIDIQSGSKKINVAETYNSGTKTVFISKEKARIRLLSLMRIESIFFLPATDSSLHIFRVKESGRKFVPSELSMQEWRKTTSKYDSAHCELIAGDTKKILGYNCSKAIVHLADGRMITAYYTKEIKPLKSILEPAFASLPGLVLEYSYKYKNGSSTYTATSILQEAIDPEIFSLGSKYPEKIKL